MHDDHLFPNIPVLQQKHANAWRNRKVTSRHRQTNDLTTTIIQYLLSRGHYAVRITVTGIYSEREKRWRRSTTERGTADIHSCIRGRHVSIEVKTGDDEQSDEQRKVEEKVVSAGGIYLIVHEFLDFHVWYKTFIQPTP